MLSDFSKVVPGYYNADQIRAIANENFPDEYNAIPDADQLPWEQQDDTATFHKETLFIGYVKIDNMIWKVSAYMLRSTGEIHLYRNGMRLTRADNAHLRLGIPWSYLREGGERPHLRDLQVLCQNYFVGAEFAVGVKVKDGSWFKRLSLACKAVGEGLGLLLVIDKEDTAVGFADRVGESDVVDGKDEMDVNKTSKISQQRLGFARGQDAH